MGTVLFAFDFMHFTQTRIATIDTYAVFFLLLMYDAMAAFLKQDLLAAGWKKLLPPLLLCGVFTGLGVAAKWTAAYGALGLAALFLREALPHRPRRPAPGGPPGPGAPKVRKALRLLLPILLGHPLFDLLWGLFAHHHPAPQRRGRVGGLLELPGDHVQLPREPGGHPRLCLPLVRVAPGPAAHLVFLRDTWEGYSTISAFGNPLLWWAGLPALGCAGWLWWKERRRWAGLALAGFLSVYLPWALVPRLTFIYHYLYGGALFGGVPVRGVLPAV